MARLFCFTLFLFFQNMGFSQKPIFKIPKGATLDSLFQMIYRAYEMDSDDVRRGQQYGWYKYSEKINADSFFLSTLKYCTDRVGEEYFYRHFRFDVHSFKDDPFSEVFTIRYRFYPPGFAKDDYVDIVFKRLDFLSIYKMSFPKNLPDCQADPKQCAFPITREKAMEIAKKELVKDREMKVNLELDNNLKWKGTTYTEGQWQGENFFIDARTGKLSGVKGWHRID